MKDIPTSDLWILIAHGEGAASLVCSDLWTGFHTFSCCCGASSLAACGSSESLLSIWNDMEDENNWELDEQGKPFSFTYSHECGHVTITRLNSDDCEVER